MKREAIGWIGRFLPITRLAAPIDQSSLNSIWRYASQVNRASPAAAADAIAKGLVEPDSRILIHYKKNLPRPQLTRRIMRRGDLTELRDMIRLYHSRMDGAHVAACLCKLSSLISTLTYKPTSSAADLMPPALSPQAVKALAIEAATHLAPIVRLAAGEAGGTNDLKRDVPTKSTLLKFDTAATVLWALAKLPIDVRRVVCPGPILDQIISRATRSNQPLHEASPDRISLFLWSLAKLSFSPTSCSEAASVAIPSLATRHPLDSSLIDDVDSMVNLNADVSPYPLPSSVSSAVNAALSMTLKSLNRRESYLKQCSPANLAMFCTSLSALGRVELSLTKPLADEVVTRIHNRASYQPFEAADYVGVVRGMASVLEETFLAELALADDEALVDLEGREAILRVAEGADRETMGKKERELESSGSEYWELLKRWKHGKKDPYMKEVRQMMIKYRELKGKGLSGAELKREMKTEVFEEVKAAAAKVMDEVAAHLSSPARSLEMQGGRGSSWKVEHLVHLASAYAVGKRGQDEFWHSIKVAVKFNRERMQPVMINQLIKAYKALGKEFKI